MQNPQRNLNPVTPWLQPLRYEANIFHKSEDKCHLKTDLHENRRPKLAVAKEYLGSSVPWRHAKYVHSDMSTNGGGVIFANDTWGL